MQIVLYALRKSEGWSFEISLDLRIDLMWWTSEKRGHEQVQQIICISSIMPLGWAIQCQQYLELDRRADHWNPTEWKQYIEEWLYNRIRKYNRSTIQYNEIQSVIPINQIKLLWSNQPNKQIDQVMSLDWKRQAMRGATTLAHMMQGRSLLSTEYIMMMTDRQVEHIEQWKTYTQLAYLTQSVQLLTAVQVDSISGYQCQRCGSNTMNHTPCASCGSSSCAYCETCLNLGRSRECTLLIQSVYIDSLHTTSLSIVDTHSSIEHIQTQWGLSDAQTEATTSALHFLKDSTNTFNHKAMFHKNQFIKTFLHWMKNKKELPRTSYFTHKRFLLWAVTGAGKTEMTFPLIDRALKNNGRVLVATPRRDVVLELAPRMAKAFPTTTLAVLYGGSEDRWQEADLTIATTHQLLRFSQAFDLVILDELDAFPFHNDPMLAYAANRCCKSNGAFIYLSATPPTTLQKEIKRGILAHAKVPARFHGHPLPVPKYIAMPTVNQALKRKQLAHGLLKHLRYSVTRQAQIFVFVARIALIEPLVALLRSYFPNISIEGTSSQDVERAKKVLLFREQQIRILVTTTILERGVTIPYSDVYILDANSGLFDAASLVQMAGRAGRSKEDPAGHVIFASKQWTIEQKKAVAQIKQMNRIAKRKGYLHMSQSITMR